MLDKNLKILFVASECAPFVKVGGLGDVIGGLPKELQKIGVDARVILPLYKTIDVKKHNLKPVFRGRRLKVQKGMHGIGLWSGTLPRSKVPVYFVENKKYLGSGGVYFSKTSVADPRAKNFSVGVSHKKEIERFVLFSEAVFSLLKEKLLPFDPDIVHAHDWHSGHLVAQIANHKSQVVKQKKRKPELINSPTYKLKTVLTIHNLSNQGILRNKNILKGGILNADSVTTVSPAYAEEIQTKEHGLGLQALLRKKKLIGILSGFDYGSLGSFGEKSSYKLSFQKAHGLKHGSAHPLFGVVSRLYEQKGIQWVIPIVSCLAELFDAEFAFLGTGEDEFEEALSDLARRYPQNVFTKIGIDHELAGSIYAASDFFLMPSSFEPCGLSQIIAMHYGTLPIARATGGPKDIIQDGKTGFLFEEKNEKALLHAIQRALGIFVDEEAMKHMRERALHEDFSWGKSAERYAKLYKQLITSN